MTSSAWWDVQLRRHPLAILIVLLAVAATIELLQYRPELFPGGHAAGEIVRNLAYALIGAQVFHLLVVELPGRRRRRATYEFSEQAMQVLTVLPAGHLHPYQQAAALIGFDLDLHDRQSFTQLADALVARGVGPAFYGHARVTMMKHYVEVVMPRALHQLAPSVAYFDPEVSHALSLFPSQDGLTNVLQVRLTPTGDLEHQQDAHLTWELLTAARGLYQALLVAEAYSETFFEGSIGEPPNQVALSAHVLLPPTQ